MSAVRDARLSPADLALKLATREAVKAAGGQEFAAQETGRTQSRISDWGNPNVPEFMPIDAVRKIEALGAGSPGHPHITAALARSAGVPLGDAIGGAEQAEGAAVHLSRLAVESSDVIRALAAQVARRGELSPSARAALLGEVAQLLEAAMQLHCDLTRAEGEE